MPLMTFAEAIEDSEQYSKRHLLLGNGFSIACRADIFHYGSLFAQADFTQVPEVEAVFAALGTIPGNHPNVPPDIPDVKFWACRRFLSHFLEGPKAGQVFTLNYDLLLYWTLMHDDMPFDDPINLAKNDGFGNDEDDPDADYVVWQGETGAHDARVHFLHGALHLFDSGAELKKYTWVRTNVPLVDQARAAIAVDAYPLFVAEGTSAKKKAKIRHNAYLYQGFKQFTANIKVGTHCMFIFGHSLAANDDHILVRIGRGRFKKLYVGIFGDPLTDDNLRIMARAQELAAMRHASAPLEVVFYDAASANVWGDH